MTDSWGVELKEIDLPVFDLPRVKPTVPDATYAERLAAATRAAEEKGLDALLVYGDREHFANTSYLTGFDPRYEESLMIIIPGRTPVILVGNESVGYASGVAPYELDVKRLAKFSLVGQPDPGDVTMSSLLIEAGLDDPAIKRVGIAGWKFWTGAEATEWIDAPHFIVSELLVLVDTVENATDIFVSPDCGLRLINEVDQIAYFEFAASHGSAAVRRVIEGIRPGMTELEASQLMQPIMLPFNYHPTMLGGPNTSLGVASAGSRELEVGDPVATGIGYWGSNTARAGFLVDHADQLPDGAKDYVEKLAAPYFATAAAWYETIRIGITGAELYEVTFSRIGDDFYGVYLNPGHFIHLDEWPASSVTEHSTTVFKSGHAVQLDIIPITGSVYHTAQIEDGVVLADEKLRDELSAAYPEAWARIMRRREMLQDVFGITVHDEVLPLSNTAGYFAPFWLSPSQAMVRS